MLMVLRTNKGDEKLRRPDTIRPQDAALPKYSPECARFSTGRHTARGQLYVPEARIAGVAAPGTQRRKASIRSSGRTGLAM